VFGRNERIKKKRGKKERGRETDIRNAYTGGRREIRLLSLRRGLKNGRSKVGKKVSLVPY